MSHFAKVKNQKVLQVIVAEQEFIDSLPTETGVEWIQTSYNTRGGVHYGWKEITVTEEDGTTFKTDQPFPDGGVPLRKNYAGIGDTYDSVRDAFYGPQPYPSWSLNETSCIWEAPVAYPNDGKLYDWNESNLAWEETT